MRFPRVPPSRTSPRAAITAAAPIPAGEIGTARHALRRRGGIRRPSRGGRWLARYSEAAGAAALTFPYLILLTIIGVLPVVYSLKVSFSDPQSGQLVGLDNYVTAISDFRFLNSFTNVGVLMGIWIPVMMVLVLGLALLVDATQGWFSGWMRFLYYLPGAASGMANLVLWLLLLDPTTSPLRAMYHALGWTTLSAVVVPNHVPFVIALMLLYSGAGSWILILYGGLRNIPETVKEAARLDGAGPWSMAWRIKIPLIRRWLGYMALMNCAVGLQTFLEPQVLGSATFGTVDATWSPNELAYMFAFQQNNLPSAAALSVILVIVTLTLSVVAVVKTDLIPAK